MKNNLILVLIIFILIFSCNENGDVLPRNNPRFSVAQVQLNNKNEVQFMANVFDYGSDEIIEYGFIFNSRSQLDIEKDEVVKESGSPGKSFTLMSNYSLDQSKTYYVKVFIRTNKAVVYSDVISFKSN